MPSGQSQILLLQMSAVMRLTTVSQPGNPGTIPDQPEVILIRSRRPRLLIFEERTRHRRVFSFLPTIENSGPASAASTARARTCFRAPPPACTAPTLRQLAKGEQRLPQYSKPARHAAPPHQLPQFKPAQPVTRCVRGHPCPRIKRH